MACIASACKNYVTGRVTAVVPAYNAGRTLEATLRSVRAQTYRDLEILVVNDGSTDRTGEIAASHAHADRRVRPIAQANAGVASARNRGLAEATGEFVALIDADDLWKPEKIAAQLEVLTRSGRHTGLVYTWFAEIDERGRVLTVHRPAAEGDVLTDLCVKNIVGHASSPLMRTRDVLDIGGYDPSLRARNAQGCEDLDLYLRVAERSHFAVVKSVLTGYRKTRDAMSTDVRQMLRSYDIVIERWIARYPHLKVLAEQGRCDIVEHLLYVALHNRRFGAVAGIYSEFLRYEPRRALALAPRLPLQVIPWPARRSLKARLKRRPLPQFPQFLTETAGPGGPPFMR
jgi:glycosyltransferase involved in cell wall biosynthesis